VAASARYDVAESEAEAGGDFAEVDAAGAVEWVGVTADVILTAEGDGAAGGNEGSREDAVVVAEDELRTKAEVSAEGEPVEGRVAGPEVKVDADVGPLLLEGRGVAEKVSACAQVKPRCERCGNVKAGSCETDSRGES
jgi:hypothetical protein